MKNLQKIYLRYRETYKSSLGKAGEESKDDVFELSRSKTNLKYSS